MKRIIVLFLLFLPLATSGQVLYLKMDTSQPKQHSDSWELKNNKYYKIFAYQSTINYLMFSCDNKATDSQILPISELANYNVRTITDIENSTAHLSRRKALSSFGGYQTIYIVEILPSGTHFELSKVRLFTIG